jgi:hypothetical protein
MKILTKEEEAEHYRETLKGGTLGGVLGLGVGFAGVALASQRYHFIRTLTLPLKAFLVTSSGTFAGIIAADHWSRAYEFQRNPKAREYAERNRELHAEEEAGKTFAERGLEWARAERYKIVGGSWILSMVTAFAIVNRDKYLTGAQKIVQARVYAQFLTLGVLVASAAFEISDQRKQQGRYETVKYVDPNDPEHKRMLEKQVEVGGKGSGSAYGGQREDRQGRDLWKDMVESEEERIKAREKDEKRLRGNGHEKHKKGGKKEEKEDKKKDDESEDEDEGKDDEKDDKKDAKKDSKKDDKKDDKKEEKKDDKKK